MESIIDSEITVNYNNHIKPIGHELLLYLQTSQKCGVFYVTFKIVQNKKSRALSLPSYREDVAKDLLKIPQMLPTPEGSYPQTEGL